MCELSELCELSRRDAVKMLKMIKLSPLFHEDDQDDPLINLVNQRGEGLLGKSAVVRSFPRRGFAGGWFAK
jgi:hypothetical protein